MEGTERHWNEMESNVMRENGMDCMVMESGVWCQCRDYQREAYNADDNCIRKMVDIRYFLFILRIWMTHFSSLIWVRFFYNMKRYVILDLVPFYTNSIWNPFEEISERIYLSIKTTAKFHLCKYACRFSRLSVQLNHFCTHFTEKGKETWTNKTSRLLWALRTIT